MQSIRSLSAQVNQFDVNPIAPFRTFAINGRRFVGPCKKLLYQQNYYANGRVDEISPEVWVTGQCVLPENHPDSHNMSDFARQVVVDYEMTYTAKELDLYRLSLAILESVRKNGSIRVTVTHKKFGDENIGTPKEKN